MASGAAHVSPGLCRPTSFTRGATRCGRTLEKMGNQGVAGEEHEQRQHGLDLKESPKEKAGAPGSSSQKGNVLQY